MVKIRLCNGDFCIITTQTRSTTNRAIEQGVLIYTVGLGNGINETLLRNIANSTGGKYYYAALSSDLLDVFHEIEDETINEGEIDTTDTDGDGLYDIYETAGMKTPSGIVYSDPNLADTDGDGLTDGKEMGEYIHSYTELLYSGFLPTSNPNYVDSDDDGLKDPLDTRPFWKDALPKYYKEYIKDEIIPMKQFEKTSDGFTLCTMPLSDIFTKLGIEEIKANDKSYFKPKHFEDWYFYSVTDNKTEYSILKLRGLDTVDKNGNGNSGTAVPFIKLDMSLIDNFSNEDSESQKLLYNELKKVTTGGTYSYSPILVDYFRNVKSLGSYLIADIYIQKMIDEDSTNNRIKVEGMCDDISDRWKKLTEKNPKLYDKDTSELIINDPNNLKLNEKQAILLCRAGNPSFNSFAAENLYHAKMTNDYGELDKDGNSNLDFRDPMDKYIVERGIVSNTGIGEESYFFGFFFGDSFRDYNGKYVVDQRNTHGDK